MTDQTPADEDHLQRNLQNRHLQLIAIGGAMGAGLFMGSGKTVHAAVPSLLLFYTIIGVMLFFVMRAMGELLLHDLRYESFQDFSAEMLGPWAGFFSGWTYWMCWVVTGMADVVAISGYWDHWVDDKTLSIVLAALVMLGLPALNLLTVKLFGLLGLTAAASVMNFVVLTSASSSCNSGIYSTSRMLYGLAHRAMAHERFGRLSNNAVPHRPGGLGDADPDHHPADVNDSIMDAFTIVTPISSVLFIFVWTLILLSYMRYLKRFPEAHARSIFKVPGARFMPQVVLVFFAFVLVLLTQESDTRRALLVTPLWFIVLGVAWYHSRGNVVAPDADDATPAELHPT